MLTRRFFMTNSVIGLATWLGAPRFVTNSAAAEALRVAHTDAEWGMLLTPDQYAVLRQSATERPFTSPLLNEHRPGVFACAGCDLACFRPRPSSRAAQAGRVSGRH
jgi:peptide-methionine (R)-S-oxide reductase